MEKRVFEEEEGEVHQVVEEQHLIQKHENHEEEKKDSLIEKDFKNINHQTFTKLSNQIAISEFEDDLNVDFMVSNPDDKNGHVEYKVKGKDKQGEWEGSRRFTHFFLLHEILVQRWPGFYLPWLPPKKAIGRYESKFIQQRRYGLERYIRKLGNNEFIINSDEFLVFSRPNGGDPEKILARLTKIPYSQIIERMQRSLRMTEKIDISDKEEYAGKIVDFLRFANKTLPQLKELKHKLDAQMVQRETSNGLFKDLFKVMPVYEEDNIMCYTGGKVEKLVFAEAAKNEETSSLMQELQLNMRNPVEWMYWWCRGEIYDIKALKFAIEQRESIDKQQLKLKQKVAELREDLEKITQGKSSMRTMFKNSNDSISYESQISTLDRDIENLGQLHDLVTIHLARDAIPGMKKQKMKIYSKMLQTLSSAEISNAHVIASFWHKIALNPYVVREVTNTQKKVNQNAASKTAVKA